MISEPLGLRETVDSGLGAGRDESSASSVTLRDSGTTLGSMRVAQRSLARLKAVLILYNIIIIPISKMIVIFELILCK